MTSAALLETELADVNAAIAVALKHKSLSAGGRAHTTQDLTVLYERKDLLSQRLDRMSRGMCRAVRIGGV